MLKAMFYLLAALGYGIVINLAKPILSSALGDSSIGYWIQVILVIVPILTLVGLSQRAMQGHRRQSELNKSEKSTNRNELLWSGKLSLTQAYWCGYVPYAIFSAFCGNYAMSKVNKFQPSETKLAIVAVIFIIAMLALSILGVWRSGERYGGNRLWVILSRITMVLGVIAVCLFIYMESFGSIN
jgi:uncharacterized membrane protein